MPDQIGATQSGRYFFVATLFALGMGQLQGCASGKSSGSSAAGATTGNGGTTSAGGTTATGGTTSTGGATPTGAATSTVGSTGSGGTVVSGGTTASGGTASTGGSVGSGGILGTGGTASTGGSVGSGGIRATGGISATRSDAADTNAPDARGSEGGAAGGSGGFDPCPATGNCKILPLGDSITAGAGAQPGDGGGYRVELFTKAVNDSKHITFVGSLSSGPSTVAGVAFPKNHEGHIGWTIAQVNSIATTAQTVTASGQSYAGALRDSPQIVLLFIGTNDEGYLNSEAGASDRLGQLIDKIVAALPNSLLVVSSIYAFPGCSSTNYTPTECAGNVATYDNAVPGVVKQRADQGKHVIYVDMSTLPSGALSTDGVHPNDTVGYPWMGDNWYTTIKSYLH